MNGRSITVCTSCQAKECEHSDGRERLFECAICLETFPTLRVANNCCSRLSRPVPPAGRIKEEKGPGRPVWPCHRAVFGKRYETY